MTFVVMGLGTVFNALTNRRDPASGLTRPILKAVGISLVPVVMIVLATQLPALQSGLLTQALTGRQWLACIGLALIVASGNRGIEVAASSWRRRTRPDRRRVRGDRFAQGGGGVSKGPANGKRTGKAAGKAAGTAGTVANAGSEAKARCH